MAITNRQYIAFVGWEGAGKSFCVDAVHKNLGFFKVPEMARVMMPVSATILNKPLELLSESTLAGYIAGHHICSENNIVKSVQDRCILDPLCYQAMYSPELQFNLDELQGYIDSFNESHNQESMLDTLVLLRHPKDKQFILDNVFTDTDRKYSTSVEQYKADASRFEDQYRRLYKQFNGIANRFIEIDAFPENENVLSDCTLIAGGIDKLSEAPEMICYVFKTDNKQGLTEELQHLLNIPVELESYDIGAAIDYEPGWYCIYAPFNDAIKNCKECKEIFVHKDNSLTPLVDFYEML